MKPAALEGDLGFSTWEQESDNLGYPNLRVLTSTVVAVERTGILGYSPDNPQELGLRCRTVGPHYSLSKTGSEAGESTKSIVR